ncbi:MAG: hypothetical protein J6N55_04160 [Anaerovibrio sp.]|uniref:hypothetical protein n=1 Tax=Anaerovibrio sp. TaxID=1872532 RepID=UPI001B2CA273|nr:hypothetical protein [Anaerovibrio sp.]MBO6245459.1 hypothetical protein [Anaerovibrio sp.]
MIYPVMTLEDDTVITHTEMRDDGTVKVYIETPDEQDCFHSMECVLPEYRIENVKGYSKDEVEHYLSVVKSNVSQIKVL